MNATERVIAVFARRAGWLERTAANPNVPDRAAGALERRAERYNRAVRYGWRRIARGV